MRPCDVICGNSDFWVEPPSAPSLHPSLPIFFHFRTVATIVSLISLSLSPSILFYRSSPPRSNLFDLQIRVFSFLDVPRLDSFPNCLTDPHSPSSPSCSGSSPLSLPPLPWVLLFSIHTPLHSLPFRSLSLSL